MGCYAVVYCFFYSRNSSGSNLCVGRKLLTNIIRLRLWNLKKKKRKRETKNRKHINIETVFIFVLHFHVVVYYRWSSLSPHQRKFCVIFTCTRTSQWEMISLAHCICKRSKTRFRPALYWLWIYMRWWSFSSSPSLLFFLWYYLCLSFHPLLFCVRILYHFFLHERTFSRLCVFVCLCWRFYCCCFC